MPINASPHYQKAEQEYLEAETTEQKIKCLKKMLVLAPKHKGSENLLARLKRRLAKLKYSKEKEIRQAKHSGQKGIKKEDMQAIIIGKTNTGKSSLLNLITNASPKIKEYQFTTKEPLIGMITYQGANIQLVENPAIDSEYYDKGIINSTDTILSLITNLEDLNLIKPLLEKSSAKNIIIFNKIDNLNETQKRKISATLQSKKYNFVLISTKTKEGIEELKEKLFKSFRKIRIFTKEPGKDKSPKPIILEPNSIVKDVAEKILKKFSEKIKETKIWGPSSKFPGQKVGLKHELKDLDVVEFKTK